MLASRMKCKIVEKGLSQLCGLMSPAVRLSVCVRACARTCVCMCACMCVCVCVKQSTTPFKVLSCQSVFKWTSQKSSCAPIHKSQYQNNASF